MSFLPSAFSTYPPEKLLGPTVAAPAPLGLWATLTWTIGAIGAALLAMAAILAAVRRVVSQIDLVSIAIAGSILVLFGTIILACRWRGWRTIDYLALTKPKGQYIYFSAVGFMLPLVAFATISQIGHLAEDYKAPSTLNSLFITLIGMSIIAPVGEELFFRGFLYRGLAASRLGAGGAIVLTALVWAGLHIDRTLLGFVEVFFCGLVWGWLRWRTGSTISTIAVHTLTNAIPALTIAGMTLGWWTA